MFEDNRATPPVVCKVIEILEADIHGDHVNKPQGILLQVAAVLEIVKPYNMPRIFLGSRFEVVSIEVSKSAPLS